MNRTTRKSEIPAAENSELFGGGNCELSLRLPRWRVVRPDTTVVERLTRRERLVFQLTAEGYSKDEIAWMLRRSPKTIDKQLDHIRQRVGTRDRVALCRLAIRAGWMEP